MSQSDLPSSPASSDHAASDSESQVQQAHARIEEMIVTTQLAPGQIVSENSLAQTIQIGRTPIREALQQLARQGLVVILPKRGVMVANIDFGRQLRMLEFRRATERYMVAAAARRATPAEKAKFRRLGELLEAAHANRDGAAFLLLDVEFSALLATAARNEFATGAMTLMHGLSRRFGYAFDPDGALLPAIAKLHAELANAIAASDAEEAMQRLDALLDYVERFTREALEPR